MLPDYRADMTQEEFHAWAFVATQKLELLTTVLREIITVTEPLYALIPEGKIYLNKMKECINA